jgi:hypothetical protein
MRAMACGAGRAVVVSVALAPTAVRVAERVLPLRLPGWRVVCVRGPCVVERRTGAVRVRMQGWAGWSVLLVTQREARRIGLRVSVSRRSGGCAGGNSWSGGRRAGPGCRVGSRLRRRVGGAGAGRPVRRTASRVRGGGDDHRRRRAGRSRRDRGRLRRVRRRRSGAVGRLLAGRARSHHDLRRGRRRRGAGAGRGEVHGARVEEQGHRGGPEKQRNQGRRDPSGGYPHCVPRSALVGRHRPLLPFLNRPPPALAQRYKKPDRSATRGESRRSLFPGNHYPSRPEPAEALDPVRVRPGLPPPRGDPAPV